MRKMHRYTVVKFICCTAHPSLLSALLFYPPNSYVFVYLPKLAMSATTNVVTADTDTNAGQ